MSYHKITLAIVLSTIFLINFLYAQTPQLLNYQGKLVNKDGTTPSGTFSIIFSIYSDSAGTTDLWREAQPIVSVTNGIFNILLGSVIPFPDDLFTSEGERYLGIKVGTEPEMRPLFQLTSVPFAIHANSATSLSSTPVAARWYATNHEAQGPVNYQWGMEIFNTDPNSLSVTSDGYEIEVKKAGYYMVCVSVLQMGLASGERGDVWLMRNGNSIGHSLGYGASQQFYKHNLTIIEHFKEGDKISVYCRDHLIYAADLHWSSLEIYKLN